MHKAWLPGQRLRLGRLHNGQELHGCSSDWHAVLLMQPN